MDYPQSQGGWEYLLQQKFDRQEVIAFLKSNKAARAYFRQICLLPKAYAWRAAWLLRGALDLTDNHEEWVEMAVGLLAQFDDGHQREILKILGELPLHENDEGPLFDVCMGIWEKPGKSPSVRMSAFLFILDTVKKYPELKAELNHLTQEHFMESLSPGVRKALEKRVKAFLK